MTRSHDIPGLGLLVYSDSTGVRTVRSANASRDTLARFDRHRKCRVVGRLVVGGHHMKPQPLHLLTGHR